MADVLVLGGGGVVGEAWMSAVLSGLEDGGFDARGCRAYVGTSAGSIVAASLVAGLDPRSRLGALPEPPAAAPPRVQEAGAPWWHAVGGPLAAAGLAATRPAGALIRRAALSRVPPGRRSLDVLRHEIEKLGIVWDGRLRIAVVELDSGRRVVFGSTERRTSRSRSPSRRRVRSRGTSGRSGRPGTPTSTAAPGARRTWMPRRRDAATRCSA